MEKYSLTHLDSYWEAIVEIDTELSKIPIKDMVEFWSDWEYNLALNDGDYIITFLKQLARKIFIIKIETDYNIKGILREIKESEGYYPLDGSHGIKLTFIDNFYPVNMDDFSIKKI